jgi:hypothetical protein
LCRWRWRKNGKLARAIGARWPLNGGGNPALDVVVDGMTDSDIRKFGAKCDGVTDDSAAIQACVNFQPSNGGSVVIYGQTRCLATINLTNRKSIEIRGFDAGTRFISGTNGKPTFDCLGAERTTFRDLQIRGEIGRAPNVCFFFGRTMTGSNSSWNSFENLVIDGHFGLGVFYMVSSEVNQWRRVNLCISGETSVQFGIYICGHNDLGLLSEFETLKTDIHSCAQQFMDNVSISGSPTGLVPFKIGSHTFLVHLDHIYASTPAQNMIQIIGDNSGVEIGNFGSESALADHTIFFMKREGGQNRTRRFRITQSDLSYRHAGIGMEPGTVIQDATIEDIQNTLAPSAGNPLFEFATLEQAEIKRWGIPYDTGKIIANVIRDSMFWVRDANAIESSILDNIEVKVF